MKLFALLDSDNKVINISQAADDWIANDWIQYDDKNPAFIGGDFVDGYFYAPQPFPSWTRNEGNWLPPVPMPLDGKYHIWNEELGNWNETKTI